jgi:hypothetical protein
MDAEREEMLKRKDLEIYELQEANMLREGEVANLTVSSVTT